jgi:hypothetical protein
MFLKINSILMVNVQVIFNFLLNLTNFPKHTIDTINLSFLLLYYLAQHPQFCGENFPHGIIKINTKNGFMVLICFRDSCEFRRAAHLVGLTLEALSRQELVVTLALDREEVALRVDGLDEVLVTPHVVAAQERPHPCVPPEWQF